MSLTPIPFNNRIRIVDPTSGYLTAQGYRFLEAMRASVIGLEDDAGDGTLASSLLTFEANATPGGGADAQIDMKTRAAADDTFTEAGLTIRSFVSGMTTSSQILLTANSLYFTDGTTNTAPFSIVAGVTTLQNVVISGNLLVNGTITTSKLGNLQVTGAKIGDLEVGSGKIAFNAVTTYGTASGSGSAGPSSYTTICSVVIANDSGVMPGMQAVVSLSVTAGASPATLSFRVCRAANSGTTLYSGSVSANAGNSANATFSDFILDISPAAGSQTYQVDIIYSGAATVASGSAQLYVPYQKR